MTFNAEQKKKVVRDYIENVINTGNTENIAKYISSDYMEEYNGERFSLGIEGAKNHIKGVRETYPDLELRIDKQLCDGDWVVTCYKMFGTHEGEWMGIKPTFKKVTVFGVNVDRVVDQKIVEHGGAANLLEPLMAIDALKIIDR